MRYTIIIDGLNRLGNYRRKNANRFEDRGWYYDEKKENEQSSDTKIRIDINSSVISMIKEGKGRVQIEVILTEKYPDYSEYILKMINHQFSKFNKTTTEVSKDENSGEER